MMKKKDIAKFRRVIWNYYKKYGRQLPWRQTQSPYRVLVSEIMLQQTQVARVISKYKLFLKLFPTFSVLAKASVSDVLKTWQGLGYNRRALALKRLAQVVVSEYDGKLPQERTTLIDLPGIGPYTASALLVFAHDRSEVMVETNIRRTFIHFFFKNLNHISDSTLLPLIEATLDTRHPRTWYFALMDYGAMLGLTTDNANRRSAQYNRQSRFEGSLRQVRGAILKVLSAIDSITVSSLVKKLKFPFEKVHQAMIDLVREQFIVSFRGRVRLVS